MLACADIEEGVELREAGIAVPILIFGPFSLGDLDAVFDASLTPTVMTPTSARRLQDAAARRGVRLACHLGIDTGMHRLGLRHDNLARTMPEVLAAPNLELDGRLYALRDRRHPGGRPLRHAVPELRARRCRRSRRSA